MDKLSAWKEQMTRLDAAIRPIAHRPVSFLALLFRPRRPIHALDQAKVRTQSDKLLTEMVEYYRTADAEERLAIRKLFENHPSYAWAATLFHQPVTAESFRAHLILFSIKDQGRDTRDALIELHELCEKAKTAGVDTAPLLAEVAELSSDVNKYGMGSTRAILLNSIPKPSG